MRNRTKQIVLILVTCLAIIGLVSACISSSETASIQGLGGEGALPSSFEVSELSIDPAKVNTGEGVWITAEVTNTGETDGIYEAELRINNISEVSNKVTVPAGGTQKLLFSVSRNTPGTYEVVLGELAGEFIVAERTAIQSSNTAPVVSQPTNSGCCGSSSSGSCSNCGTTTSSSPSSQRRTGCGCGGR